MTLSRRMDHISIKTGRYLNSKEKVKSAFLRQIIDFIAPFEQSAMLKHEVQLLRWHAFTGSRVDNCLTSIPLMSSSLELHNSRIGAIERVDEVVSIYFSLAYIHRSRGNPRKSPSSVWSQHAELILGRGRVLENNLFPTFPNTIADGFIEIGGIRHELIPLPFKRKVAARLFLTFTDGAEVEIVGEKAIIELLGSPIYLEEFD